MVTACSSARRTGAPLTGSGLPSRPARARLSPAARPTTLPSVRPKTATSRGSTRPTAPSTAGTPRSSTTSNRPDPEPPPSTCIPPDSAVYFSPGDAAHEDDAREAVVAAYRAQLRAMTGSDTGALDQLLADDFAL